MTKFIGVCLLFILLLLFVSLPCMGEKAEPLLMKEPRDWRFERIDFPPQFAPDIKYDGFEELRFGPGMFDKKADYYFSYAFAIVLKNTPLEKVDLKDFLLKYFRGLIKVVSESKKMKADLTLLKISLQKSKETSLPYPMYTADLTIIDPFTDGKPLALKMEITAHPYAQEKGHLSSQPGHRIFLFLAAPKNAKPEVWKKLLAIRKQNKFSR